MIGSGQDATEVDMGRLRDRTGRFGGRPKDHAERLTGRGRLRVTRESEGCLSVVGPRGHGVQWLMAPVPRSGRFGRPAAGGKVERPAGRTTLAPARTAVGSVARGGEGLGVVRAWRSLVWWVAVLGLGWVMVHAGALAYLGARTVAVGPAT